MVVSFLWGLSPWPATAALLLPSSHGRLCTHTAGVSVSVQFPFLRGPQSHWTRDHPNELTLMQSPLSNLIFKYSHILRYGMGCKASVYEFWGNIIHPIRHRELKVLVLKSLFPYKSNEKNLSITHSGFTFINMDLLWICFYPKYLYWSPKSQCDSLEEELLR